MDVTLVSFVNIQSHKWRSSIVLSPKERSTLRVGHVDWCLPLRLTDNVDGRQDGDCVVAALVTQAAGVHDSVGFI